MHYMFRPGLSDATIICEDRTLAVHKFILCGRSEWFRTALDGPFVVSKASSITIEEIPADKVSWLLEFICGGAELSLKDAPGFNSSIFVAYCEAYELGHYFRLPLLTTGVVTALSEQPGPSASDLQYTTDPFPKAQLTAEYTCAFFHGVARAYANNSPAFRPLQRAFVVHTLRQRHIVLADPGFTGCLGDEPCFAKDILLGLLKEQYGGGGSRLTVPEQVPDTSRGDFGGLLPGWGSVPFTTSENGAPWQAGLRSPCDTMSRSEANVEPVGNSHVAFVGSHTCPHLNEVLLCENQEVLSCTVNPDGGLYNRKTSYRLLMYSRLAQR
ncbi:hypothetical protein DL768_010374 [Monosporascus sp. mg162]|nr:hypothetical protein DL768_010374 [Monosporascus sp. mg162]